MSARRWLPVLVLAAALAAPAAAQAAFDPLPLFLQHDIPPARVGTTVVIVPSTGKVTSLHTCVAHARTGKRTFDKVAKKIVTTACEQPPLANVNVAGTILLGP